MSLNNLLNLTIKPNNKTVNNLTLLIIHAHDGNTIIRKVEYVLPKLR